MLATAPWRWYLGRSPRRLYHYETSKGTMIGFSYQGTSVFCIGLLLFSFPCNVESLRVGNVLSFRCRHGHAHAEWDSSLRYSHAPLHYSQIQSKLGAIWIREWRQDDVEQIKSLLSSSDLDPEGPLEVDCGSAAAIQESYSNDDGGYFLVATDESNDEMILGTAALIVGTQVHFHSQRYRRCASSLHYS